MMDRKRIVPQLDPQACPQTTVFLETHDADSMSAYELASELVECDKTLPMPKALFDFIVDLYQEAIETGDCRAMNDLGALYYDGRGCEQDYTKAVIYYRMAAQNGSRKAQENLGYCYYYGRNVPVDHEKAFHYFALGAFDGHVISLYKIGDMYRNGYYVEKNPKEAFCIYTRCLDLMNDETGPLAAGPVYLRIGSCLLEGEGTDEDPKKALVALQRAEFFLYDMVAGGDHLYEASLRAAVEGQARARAKLSKALPTWQNETDLQ